MKAILLASGGMDSTALAFDLVSAGVDVHMIAFNYGQKHRKEIQASLDIATLVGCPWNEVDLQSVGSFLTGSALTDSSVRVPEGHYAADSMKLTVVPNRNAIFLSVAFGIAIAKKANLVAAAYHAGDHFIYPDCRPEFAAAFDKMERVATEGFSKPDLMLHTPFINMTKTQVCALGRNQGAEKAYALTWSCYKGYSIHCGKCGTCVERKEAFRESLTKDPTRYEDPDFQIVAYRG